ncbi:hypothetical protein EVAR_18820_1 [Eumeta japonica]|uniref:Uncharacterized protein n=1 Tax=Eumeta variegata TaxID=151549 RepID=A0A4C1UMX7_EUMVA|nr:hypothetical protein EVAR_18820_1 [Eumeta japonica]
MYTVPTWHLMTLFVRKIKNKLRSQRFSSPEEAVEECEEHVSEVTREEWHKCFQNCSPKSEEPVKRRTPTLANECSLVRCQKMFASSVLRVGPGPACDSVPTRFYSRPVRNSLPHSAINLNFATSYDSDLDEAESKC